MAFLPGNSGRSFVQPATAVLLAAMEDKQLQVRSRSLWALANVFGVATGTAGVEWPRAPLVIDDKYESPVVVGASDATDVGADFEAYAQYRAGGTTRGATCPTMTRGRAVSVRRTNVRYLEVGAVPGLLSRDVAFELRRARRG